MRNSLVLFSLVYLASASINSVKFSQQPLGNYPTEHPDFDFDLSEMRLVELEGGAPVWMTELEKIQAKAQGLKFFDVTDTPNLASFATTDAKLRTAFPKLNHTKQVKSVIKTLSTAGPKGNLAKFTDFRTRHYRSETGKQSQKWLLSQVTQIADQAAPSIRDSISLAEFPHSWGQNSVIARINGTSSDEVVVIGAHQDSTNMWPFLPAPGADDDGSGSVTILESFRALVTAGFRPERSVEFQWYSAEEGGLLGSQAMAQDYANRKVKVIAMSQYDMTAWVKRGTKEEVGVITDFTDSGLTEFNKKLVEAYLDIPFVETKCGYACSDHASWGKAGYPSVFTIESTFENSNKNIHSTNDRIDISDEFSFDHMLEFSKLAVAFAIELAGWTTK